MRDLHEVEPVSSARVPLAAVEDLRIYFQTKRGLLRAVDGVTFDIEAGETLGLVGETGCGKSVTGRAFLRLIETPPGLHAGGHILFRERGVCPSCSGSGCSRCSNSGAVFEACPNCAGVGCLQCENSGAQTVDLLQLGPRQLQGIRGKRISLIFQDPQKALNPSLTVGEQLAEVFYRHRSGSLLERSGLSTASPLIGRAAQQRSTFIERQLLHIPPFRTSGKAIQSARDELVADALAEVQIPNPRKVMRNFPHELSTGMNQRVMIAQALACDPDLLIADEPTTAFDVTVQHRILELLRQLQEHRHTAILYISHDLAVIRRVCERVAVLYAGQVVETGNTRDVFEAPLHPYTEGLLAAVPSVAHRRGGLSAIPGRVPELLSPEPQCRFHTRCPYAASICATQPPSLGVRTEASQRAACFLYEGAEDRGVPLHEMPSRRGNADAEL